MDRSGDFGLVFFNIIEETVDYRLLFRDGSNHLLDQTASLKFSCDSGICELTILLDEYSTATAARYLDVDYIYDSSAQVINITWDDATQVTQQVRILVRKDTGRNIIDICDTTQSGNAGTYSCNVAGYNGEVFLTVQAASSPFLDTIKYWIRLNTTTIATVLEQSNINIGEGAMWTAGIIITTVMSSLTGPIGPLVMAVVGLFVAGPMLGLLNGITMVSIIFVAVLSMIIGYVVKK
jgi:hypothetical protein